jgi:hypothetical protein
MIDSGTGASPLASKKALPSGSPCQYQMRRCLRSSNFPIGCFEKKYT